MCNTVRLIKSGQSYFQLLMELVQQASHSIYIRVYLWEEDKTGLAVADALLAAADRGVSVFITVDGFASQHLSKQFISNLKSRGVHFRFFEPLLRSHRFYFGRRMHEKVVVVDGLKALVGGINIADRYNAVNEGQPWLDFALFAEGRVALQLFTYCSADWKTPAKDVPMTVHSIKQCCSVRVRYNDWVKGKHQVWKTYFHAFNHAQKSISIICSYFLPGSILMHRLFLAAKRGVKVKVVLAGPSDVMLAKYAERYLYKKMIRKGIEIYEYKPSVLHAKLMVVDERLVTIGSFNVNNMSAYASMELNLDVRNRPFAKKVQRLVDEIIETHCIPVRERSIARVGVLRNMLQKTAYEVVRVLLNLSTFYFKHE